MLELLEFCWSNIRVCKDLILGTSRAMPPKTCGQNVQPKPLAKTWGILARSTLRFSVEIQAVPGAPQLLPSKGKFQVSTALGNSYRLYSRNPKRVSLVDLKLQGEKGSKPALKSGYNA